MDTVLNVLYGVVLFIITLAIVLGKLESLEKEVEIGTETETEITPDMQEELDNLHLSVPDSLLPEYIRQQNIFLEQYLEGKLKREYLISDLERWIVQNVGEADHDL